MTIALFGRFKEDISVNATTFFFAVSENATAGWGNDSFCSLSTVVQTIDSITDSICPPVKGSGLIVSTVVIPPGVELVRANWTACGKIQEADETYRVRGT